MAIGAAGWALINVAVSKASPTILARTGPAVSKLIGRPVQSTTSAIMTALKQWAKNNPKKFLIGSNLLAAVGIDIAADELTDVVSDLTDDPEVQALLSEVQATIVSERQMYTGDGDTDTIHGMDKDEYLDHVKHFTEINATIRKAIQAIGSLSALEALRTAVFLEDADYVAFKESRY